MIRLPLAARELSRLAKNPRMFWLRMIVILSAFLLLLANAIYSSTWTPTNPEAIGRIIYSIGTMFQFAIVFVVIPGITGPLIAGERREGSLGLLMVADYGGLDIFAAKFIAAFAEAEMLLLSTLPILAISAMLGGVSPDLIIKQWAVLSLCAFTTCCLGLLTSSFVRHAVSAILLNVLVVMGVIATDLVFQEFMFWNFRMLIPQVDYVRAVADIIVANAALKTHWIPLAIVGGLGLAAAIATLLWLPHAAIDRPRRRLFGPPTAYGATYRRLLRMSPAAPFIAAHSAGFLSTLHSTSSRRMLAIGMAVLALVPGVGALAVLVLLCYDITLSIGLMRREGALDDLTLTKLDERRLARDLYKFHLNRAVVYYPAFVILGIQIAVLAIATLDEIVLTADGAMRYAAIYSAVPRALLLVYQMLLGFLLIVFMAIQGPTLTAVACAAGALPEGRIPSWARAVVICILLYAVCIAIPISAHYFFFVFRIVRNYPWVLGLATAVGGVALFGASWWIALHRLRTLLGVEPQKNERAGGWPRVRVVLR